LIIAVSLGWFVDHRAQRKEIRDVVLASRVDSDLRATSAFVATSAHSVITHARHRIQSPDYEGDAWKFRLVETVRRLWQNREAMEKFEKQSDGSNRALVYATEALELLNIQSVDEYFGAARQFATQNEWPDAYEQSGPKHESFRKFVMDALNSR